MRDKCYRFTAEPSTYQTYADFKPEEGEDKCDYFWQNFETNKDLKYDK